MSLLFDVLITGAGQAGLSASYYLKKAGITHLVVERGAIGESWRSQRWDSFHLNTAKKFNSLPGEAILSKDSETFGTAQELAQQLQDYAEAHDLPVKTHTEILSIVRDPFSDLFLIRAVSGDSQLLYTARNILVATGTQSRALMPPFAATLAPEVQQLHSSAYRNPKQLRPGRILIAGSAQTGCQIAEDLADAGREVYLCTSAVPRCPRRYRGRDILDWLFEAGFFAHRAETLPDPAMLHMRAPLLKGTGDGHSTLSLQGLARKGVVLLGTLIKIEGHRIEVQNNAPDHVAFGDAFSAQVKSMIDSYIEKKQLDAPAALPDADDLPDPTLVYPVTELSLDLQQHQLTSIIWATGFDASLDYLKLPVFDEGGQVLHDQGVSKVKGVYFLGLHWQRNRQSSLLKGIAEDASFITERIVKALTTIAETA